MIERNYQKVNHGNNGTWTWAGKSSEFKSEIIGCGWWFEDLEVWIFLDFARRGNKFTDLGVSVCHHSDLELEYEIHHWKRKEKKYYKDPDPDDKIVVQWLQMIN